MLPVFVAIQSGRGSASDAGPGPGHLGPTADQLADNTADQVRLHAPILTVLLGKRRVMFLLCKRLS